MRLAETLLTPADALRSAVLRALTPWLSPLYGDRARRVWWLAVVSIVAAFVATALVPLWSLALGPVVLGVPHLVSDVRYLVVKPGLHRLPLFVVLAGAPLLVTSLGAGPEVGLFAIGPAVLAGGGLRASWRLLVTGVVAAALVAWAVIDGYRFQLVFVHAHNLVAVALWWSLSERRSSMAWVPLLTVAGAGIILLGGLDGLVTAAGGWSAPWTGTSFTEFVESSAPGLDPTMAARLVLSFCFLQSVHYAVWLRLVPDDARTRPAPRTFVASWRALTVDFGAALLMVLLLVALGIAAWGVVDLVEARWGYLRLAAFHGYLELAIAARWFVRGRWQ